MIFSTKVLLSKTNVMQEKSVRQQKRQNCGMLRGLGWFLGIKWAVAVPIFTLFNFFLLQTYFYAKSHLLSMLKLKKSDRWRKKCDQSTPALTVNEKLSWDDHVSKLYTDCARRIGILRRLRNKLNSTAFRKIFIGAIRLIIEYPCAVWSGGQTGKIAKLQDAYCRRHEIHLPPLKKRFEYHTLTLFFKKKHQMVPQCLSSLVPAPTSESRR